MTLQSYYRRALLAPFAVPVVLSPVLLLADPLQTTAGTVAVWIVYSLAFGGVQYAAFALLLARWMRGRADGAIVRAVCLAPLLFLLVLLPPWAVVEYLQNPLQWRERLSTLVLLVGGSAVVLGYAYVLLALCGAAWLARTGRAGAAEAAPSVR